MRVVDACAVMMLLLRRQNEHRNQCTLPPQQRKVHAAYKVHGSQRQQCTVLQCTVLHRCRQACSRLTAWLPALLQSGSRMEGRWQRQSFTAC
jgi:hypothetical protein